MPDISFQEIKERIQVNGEDQHNPCFLEIGANEGDDTQHFVSNFPTAEIHCFECDPRAIEKWKRNIASPNAKLYEVALSDKTGECEFHQSDGQPDGTTWENYGGHWDKSGSLLPNDQHTRFCKWMSFLPPIKVKCTTLDEWAKENLADDRIIDFAWVDVQGAEAMVLSGGQETIKRIRYWFAECDPRPLYKGMAKKQEIDSLLPGFSMVRPYPHFNFLWKNNSL
jgi:FkbM family methyltransferase